jgi:hypothetical protein
VNWATRRGCHVDRAACVWVIRRFIDPGATFVFVDDPDEVPAGTTPFDMRGAALSHHDGHCSFEAVVERYGLIDPALADVGRIVHEADLRDERFDAPEAAGLDALVRGLSMTLDDEALLQVTGPLFDGLYAFKQRARMLGHEPA